MSAATSVLKKPGLIITENLEATSSPPTRSPKSTPSATQQLNNLLPLWPPKVQLPAEVARESHSMHLFYQLLEAMGSKEALQSPAVATDLCRTLYEVLGVVPSSVSEAEATSVYSNKFLQDILMRGGGGRHCLFVSCYELLKVHISAGVFVETCLMCILAMIRRFPNLAVDVLADTTPAGRWPHLPFADFAWTLIKLLRRLETSETDSDATADLLASQGVLALICRIIGILCHPMVGGTAPCDPVAPVRVRVLKVRRDFLLADTVEALMDTLMHVSRVLRKAVRILSLPENLRPRHLFEPRNAGRQELVRAKSKAKLGTQKSPKSASLVETADTSSTLSQQAFSLVSSLSSLTLVVSSALFHLIVSSDAYMPQGMPEAIVRVLQHESDRRQPLSGGMVDLATTGGNLLLPPNRSPKRRDDSRNTLSTAVAGGNSRSPRSVKSLKPERARSKGEAKGRRRAGDGQNSSVSQSGSSQVADMSSGSGKKKSSSSNGRSSSSAKVQRGATAIHEKTHNSFTISQKSSSSTGKSSGPGSSSAHSSSSVRGVVESLELCLDRAETTAMLCEVLAVLAANHSGPHRLLAVELFALDDPRVYIPPGGVRRAKKKARPKPKVIVPPPPAPSVGGGESKSQESMQQLPTLPSIKPIVVTSADSRDQIESLNPLDSSSSDPVAARTGVGESSSGVSKSLSSSQRLDDLFQHAASPWGVRHGVVGLLMDALSRHGRRPSVVLPGLDALGRLWLTDPRPVASAIQAVKGRSLLHSCHDLILNVCAPPNASVRAALPVVGSPRWAGRARGVIRRVQPLLASLINSGAFLVCFKTVTLDSSGFCESGHCIGQEDMNEDASLTSAVGLARKGMTDRMALERGLAPPGFLPSEIGSDAGWDRLETDSDFADSDSIVTDSQNGRDVSASEASAVGRSTSVSEKAVSHKSSVTASVASAQSSMSIDLRCIEEAVAAALPQVLKVSAPAVVTATLEKKPGTVQETLFALQQSSAAAQHLHPFGVAARQAQSMPDIRLLGLSSATAHLTTDMPLSHPSAPSYAEAAATVLPTTAATQLQTAKGGRRKKAVKVVAHLTVDTQDEADRLKAFIPRVNTGMARHLERLVTLPPILEASADGIEAVADDDNKTGLAVDISEATGLPRPSLSEDPRIKAAALNTRTALSNHLQKVVEKWRLGGDLRSDQAAAEPPLAEEEESVEVAKDFISTGERPDATMAAAAEAADVYVRGGWNARQVATPMTGTQTSGRQSRESNSGSETTLLWDSAAALPDHIRQKLWFVDAVAVQAEFTAGVRRKTEGFDTSSGQPANGLHGVSEGQEENLYHAEADSRSDISVGAEEYNQKTGLATSSPDL